MIKCESSCVSIPLKFRLPMRVFSPASRSLTAAVPVSVAIKTAGASLVMEILTPLRVRFPKNYGIDV